MIDQTNFIDDNEEIILNANDHWFVMLGPFFFYMLGWAMALLIIILAFVLGRELIFVHAGLIFLAMVFIVVNHHIFFAKLFEWEISSWVISTKRVMIFDFSPLSKIDCDFVDISSIRDLKSIRHGFLKHVFSYGEVIIDPLGSSTINLKYVPHPDRFVQIVQTILKAKNHESVDVQKLKDLWND